MSETALLDASFADVGAAAARVADASVAVAQTTASAREFVQFAQATVEKTIVLGQTLRHSWETFYTRTDSPVAERARALPRAFLQRVAESLALMQFALDQAARAAAVEGKLLRDADLLSRETAMLQAIHQELLSRWNVGEGVGEAAAMGGVPLQLSNRGDIHLGRSRVLLDTIVGHYKAGMSTEDIVRGYSTVQPADVYEAIAYYLRHKDDVEAYLERRDREAAALWQHIEATQPPRADLKAQIKDRWARRKVDHAAPAE